MVYVKSLEARPLMLGREGRSPSAMSKDARPAVICCVAAATDHGPELGCNDGNFLCNYKRTFSIVGCKIDSTSEPELRHGKVSQRALPSQTLILP